ncbi:hypothetical protein PRIPAC_89309 [Pristionchus pacificus]|uniref:Uncharacterized protein n=1 Tax=Pristionchus pacificus TaxID=54126 RepID=A0A2A6B5W5_PRIPA|nr:hypothetical protein PRIPAC_89309 [Pristionchus pacificus]|eukprot:PDM61251.1 hypothetical protein PRIPAC_50693 [Pristionchus pacificus]
MYATVAQYYIVPEIAVMQSVAFDSEMIGFPLSENIGWRVDYLELSYDCNKQHQFKDGLLRFFLQILHRMDLFVLSN